MLIQPTGTGITQRRLNALSHSIEATSLMQFIFQATSLFQVDADPLLDILENISNSLLPLPLNLTNFLLKIMC